MLPLLDELAALDAKLEAAAERRRAKRERLRRGLEVSIDATADLVAYRDGIQFRQRESDADANRRLTVELIERVQRDNLIFEAVGNGLVALVDPSVQEEFAAADRELAAAKRQRNSFARKHADDLRAEEEAAEMRRVRDALTGDDPEALREALGVKDPAAVPALTSSALNA